MVSEYVVDLPVELGAARAEYAHRFKGARLAARPGARRETLEAYVKRLEKLEGLAVGYDGVDKAYAIQAGREVRVIVRQEKLSDNEALVLSRDLSKKIEQEMTYPGQIKVTVIRESRFVEFAK